jgi:NAD(P)-dependent dehydrogenase (short-subunit alcohol dehydrogenase family)
MTAEFADKVALITGGGSGIGRASVIAFASKGASVIVVDVDAEGGEETVQLVNEIDSEATFIKADVSQANEVENIVNQTVEIYGRIDYAHNNAGIEGARALTADCLEEDWDRVIGINLKGVWLCMKFEIPAMLKQGRGAIVNTASVNGLVGYRARPAYVASKHGVVGLTKAAALEYAQQGIRINAVCPGFIRTPLIERALSQYPGDEATKIEQMIIGMEPVGRMGTSEEVAQTVVWLCSDAASFVTGHAMAVDGGILAQ